MSPPAPTPTRREVLRRGVGGVVSASSAASLLPFVGCSPKSKPTATPDQPNVLLIMVDDLAPLLGCYGHPLASTPNLDRLAERGALFQNAYCTNPACNPSRASLLSGIRPSTSGVLTNTQDWRTFIDAEQTLPILFQAAGYRTRRFGKIEHSRFAEQNIWDEAYEAPERLRQRTFRLRSANRLIETFQDDPALGRVRWGPDPREDTEQPDYPVIQQALDRDPVSNQPEFLAVGLHRPHLPFIVPQRFFDAIDPQAIALPERRPTHPGPPSIYDSGLRIDQALSDEQRHGLIRAYHACVAYVDDLIGQLLDQLDATNAWDHTVVALTSDHGFLLGEHGLWRKGTLDENALRTPLLIAGPNISAGTRCNDPVSLLDLMPTLCDLAGVHIPNHAEGQSLRPILQGQPDPQRTVTCSLWINPQQIAYAVRSGRYKLTHWGGEYPDQLHDIHTDPTQAHDLALDPTMRQELDRLTALLPNA